MTNRPIHPAQKTFEEQVLMSRKIYVNRAYLDTDLRRHRIGP